MPTLPQVRKGFIQPSPRKMFPPAMPKLRTSHPRSGWSIKQKQIIEAADPFSNTQELLTKKTPTGLTESELLSSLNYIDAEALQGFTGIGPALAFNICNYRQEEYFTSLEEILNVPKLGVYRFTQLVGRKPLIKHLSLHSLMRIPPHQHITVGHLSPWIKPAPEILSASLLSKAAARKYAIENKNSNVIQMRVGTSKLVLLCSKSPESKRSKYLLKKLPRILRSINHETSITPTY